MSFRLAIRSCLGAGCALLVSVATAHAGYVIGTFGAPRVTEADLSKTTGTVATQAHAALVSHFPSVSFSTTTTLTPSFLSGVNMLMISSAKTQREAITPLTVSEQSALFDFVRQGGKAFLHMESWSVFGTPAASILAPFGISLRDDRLQGRVTSYPINLTHPIINGPYGKTTYLPMYGANIINLGPYATPLIGFSASDPTFAVIEAGAIGPQSGRVVIVADGDTFMDPNLGGYFHDTQPLFLNSLNYLLVPEPSSLALATISAASLAGLLFVRFRRANKAAVGDKLAG